jgi:hypothetical protein
MTTSGRLGKPSAIAMLALGVSIVGATVASCPATAAGSWDGMMVSVIVRNLAGHHAMLGLIAGRSSARSPMVIGRNTRSTNPTCHSNTTWCRG